MDLRRHGHTNWRPVGTRNRSWHATSHSVHDGPTHQPSHALEVRGIGQRGEDSTTRAAGYLPGEGSNGARRNDQRRSGYNDERRERNRAERPHGVSPSNEHRHAAERLLEPEAPSRESHQRDSKGPDTKAAPRPKGKKQSAEVSAQKEHCFLAVTGLMSQVLFKRLQSSARSILGNHPNERVNLVQLYVRDAALREELRRGELDEGESKEDARQKARDYHWMRQLQCAAWHATNAFHLSDDAKSELLDPTLGLCETSPEDREANVCEREKNVSTREETVKLREEALRDREERLEQSARDYAAREADVKRREAILMLSENILQKSAKSVESAASQVPSALPQPMTPPPRRQLDIQSGIENSGPAQGSPQASEVRGTPSTGLATLRTPAADPACVFRLSLSPKDIKSGVLNPSPKSGDVAARRPAVSEAPIASHQRAVSVSSDSSATESSASTTSSESEASRRPINPAIASLQRDTLLPRSGTNSARSSVGTSSTDTQERLELRERNKMAAQQKAASLTRNGVQQADRLQRQVERHRARRAKQREGPRSEAAVTALSSSAAGPSSNTSAPKKRKEAPNSSSLASRSPASTRGKEPEGRGSYGGRSEEESDPRFSEWERDLSSESEGGSDNDRSNRRNLKEMFEQFYEFYKYKSKSKEQRASTKKSSSAPIDSEARPSKRKKKRKRDGGNNEREREDEAVSADIPEGTSQRRRQSISQSRSGRLGGPHQTSASGPASTQTSRASSAHRQIATSVSIPIRKPGPGPGAPWDEREVRELETACRLHYFESRFLRSERIYKTFIALTKSTRTLAAVLQKASSMGFLARD